MCSIQPSIGWEPQLRGKREALTQCPEVHLAVGRRQGLVLSFVLRSVLCLPFHLRDKRSLKRICSSLIVGLQQPTIPIPSQGTSVELPYNPPMFLLLRRSHQRNTCCSAFPPTKGGQQP